MTDRERVAELVKRLRTSFDLTVHHAIGRLREEDLNRTAANLSEWLVSNNKLKLEAAALLAALIAKGEQQ